MIKHIAATAALATIALGAFSAPAHAADGTLPVGSVIDTASTVVVVVTNVVNVLLPPG
ncbi:hypothetical protein [Streptomyces sp. NPDC051109]|uniref:hypothetical protein n=1 Tax=Streptomyces sp. NPDC051109 TaxID=3365642 RepID=UPI00379E148D